MEKFNKDCQICSFPAKYYGLENETDETRKILTDLGDTANLLHMFFDENFANTIPLKEHQKFIDLVRDVRKAQKAFFKSRTKSNLQKAKNMENEIDHILKIESQISLF
jgi:uncharacterized protein with NAD-binding domain and iron-sulfur cluster